MACSFSLVHQSKRQNFMLLIHVQEWFSTAIKFVLFRKILFMLADTTKKKKRLGIYLSVAYFRMASAGAIQPKRFFFFSNRAGVVR